MQQSTQKKKHGGHNAGILSNTSQGSGPVFEVRAALGLSQAAMADRLGVSHSGIAKWEREGKGPRLGLMKREFEKLAAEAGVDLSEWEP